MPALGEKVKDRVQELTGEVADAAGGKHTDNPEIKKAAVKLGKIYGQEKISLLNEMSEKQNKTGLRR